MAQHSALTHIHRVYNWTYADQAAREAAAGLVPGDVGKVARQLDDDSLWMLTDDDPVTWIGLGVGGGGGSSLSNSNITPTTTNTTAAVGTRYFADISGLTADRNFVLPTCSAGDEIELVVSVGDDAFEFIIIGDTGITINGGSAATEWSRLFITNETVRLVATSTSNWQVVNDGRIPCMGKMTLSAADTTNTGGDETLPTWDTKVIDQGNLCDTTNFRFNIRRAGNYFVGCGAYPNGTLTDTQYYFVAIKRGTTNIAGDIRRASGGTNQAASASTTEVFAAGDVRVQRVNDTSHLDQAGGCA